MSYRDTATALAQRAPGNFIGVALYVPMGGVTASWNAVALMSLPALKDWYEEIAGAPTLYYYLAAFDKTQSASPVAETIAPPKPGDPAWGAYWTLQQQGYRWRPNPFGGALQKTRPTVSGGPEGEVIGDHLRRLPGLVSRGVALQNPEAPQSQWFYAYEVRWLRGQPVPSLPSRIDGHAVKLVIVDAYPVPHAAVPDGVVGAEQRERCADTAPTWYPLALIGVMFGVAYVSTSRAVAKGKRRRDELRTLSEK